MAEMTEIGLCGLCNKPVTEHDYYKELDCTFPKCPAKCYHDECMGPYLRKRGRQGTEQRTKYPCPATLANGSACPGTIRGTHNRAPTNTKKKEQAREAAVASNARQPPPAPQPRTDGTNSAKPAPAAAPKAAGGLKILVKAAPLATNIKPKANAAPLPVRNAWAASPWTSTSTPAAAAAKAAAGGGSSVTAGTGTGTTAATRNAQAPKPTSLLAPPPEPVVSQRVIPGWSGPDPAAKPGKAELGERRAQVAAMHAEARAAAGRGGGGASKEQQAASAAAPPAAQAQRTRSCTSLPSAPASVAGSTGAPAPLPEEPAADTADGAAGGGGGCGLHLDADAFEAAFRRALGQAGAGREKAADAAADAGGAADPPGGDGGAVAGVGEEEAQPDPDPVVAFDPVFAAEDGGLLVQDQYGSFRYVQDVYGHDAEFGEFPDDYGNLVYAVAIRQSKAEALALPVGDAVDTACGAAGVQLEAAASGTAPGAADVGNVLLDQGLRSAAFLPGQAGAAGAAAGPPSGAAALAPAAEAPQAQAGEEEGGDDDELEDLLALCLGATS